LAHERSYGCAQRDAVLRRCGQGTLSLGGGSGSPVVNARSGPYHILMPAASSEEEAVTCYKCTSADARKGFMGRQI